MFNETQQHNFMVDFYQQRAHNCQLTTLNVLINQLPPNSFFYKKNYPSIHLMLRPLSERPIAAYQYQFLDSYEPNKTFYLKEHDLQELHEENMILSKIVMSDNMMLRAYKACLEGTDHASTLYQNDITVLNNQYAVEYLCNNFNDMALDKTTLLALHYHLTDGLFPPEFSGKLRNFSVSVNDSRYECLATAKEIECQLNKILEKANLIKEPFEQSFFLYIHLAYLHPFTDFNKRTSRLFSCIPLLKNKRLPLTLKGSDDINRYDYTLACNILFEYQDIQPFLTLYKATYSKLINNFTDCIESLFYNTTRVIYKKQRDQLIEHIVKNNYINEILNKFLIEAADKFIKIEHREAFVKSIYIDLSLIDLARIASLNITKDELETWLALEKNLEYDINQ
jgi:Fic family protein